MATQEGDSPIRKAAESTPAAQARKKKEESDRKKLQRANTELEEQLLDELANLLDSTESPRERNELLKALLKAIEHKRDGEPFIGERMVDDYLDENHRTSAADIAKMAELAKNLEQENGYRLSKSRDGKLTLHPLDHLRNVATTRPRRREEPDNPPTTTVSPTGRLQGVEEEDSSSSQSPESQNPDAHTGDLVTADGLPSQVMQDKLYAITHEARQGFTDEKRRARLDEVNEMRLEAHKQVRRFDQSLRQEAGQRIDDWHLTCMTQINGKNASATQSEAQDSSPTAQNPQQGDDQQQDEGPPRPHGQTDPDHGKGRTRSSER